MLTGEHRLYAPSILKRQQWSTTRENAHLSRSQGIRVTIPNGSERPDPEDEMARINPDQIHSREDLIEQLARLFDARGLSIQALAAESTLSASTIHGMINGATDVPRPSTLEKFVKACGHDPKPWLEARHRLRESPRQAASASRAKGRQFREFWREFAKPDLTLVVGLHQFSRWEPSGLIGVGDAFALSEIQQHFVRIGAPSPVITYSDRVGGEARRNPLILIGGPDANAITDEIMKRLPCSLGFRQRTPHDVSIQDSQTERTYAPRLLRQGEVTDYGIVVKTRNPFNPQVPTLIVAGSFGYGSWAGARLLTETTSAELASSHASFECLFETEVVGRTPQATKVLILRELAQTRKPFPFKPDA
ncbi:helix-turn-helix domain-containing protein [Streptomyces beigongshangae]|uniref:helix-turn-helix domain-containing protein n=1 Tax=Streptomyces beigongshangae TaxID=2841597 RepID=UPI001C861E09|nr:helix-turn-helix domain-containing protein [Streptomyces sp. REN17]